jgi:hypothetical protein
MIKAFKFRAQANFSLLKSIQRSYICKKLDTDSCFAKLRANSNLFSFFIHPVEVNTFSSIQSAFLTIGLCIVILLRRGFTFLLFLFIPLKILKMTGGERTP